MVRLRKEWVIGALMAGLVFSAGVVLWAIGRIQAARGGEVADIAGEYRESAIPLEKWHGPVPSVIAERFVAAKTHEERLELVRDPDAVGPAMRSFFKAGPGCGEVVEGMHPVASATSGGLLFEAFNVMIADAPDRLLTVSVDPQGAKVDFECYARLGSVAWPDLLSGKAVEAAEVRVVLQQGGYFLHGFSEEEKWLHFKATTPDVADTLDFYLDRSNPFANQIQELGTEAFRATLSVRAVNGSEKHRQFEVTAVKALDWVEPG